MTATLTRPPDARPPEVPRGLGLSPRGPSPMVEAGAEIALVAVTAASALGLARLFADGSFAGPVLAAVAGGHLVAWAGRRLGLGLLPSALLSLAGLALAVAWFVEPHTTWMLLPRGATWQAVTADLREAWARFGEVKAPAPPLRGFVLAAVVGSWLAATTSDFFAFRMRARFEAMAPAFTLFVFGSILGGDDLRLPCTALYLAALLGYVLWSEAARQSRAGSWFAGRGREGDAALLRSGGALALAALGVAVVVGPHIPGAGSAGLVSWRDGGQGGSRSRVTVSPLVDIRGRLVDQSNLELFTVAADSPNYWRLTSLDRFDGSIWSSLGTYQPARSALAGAGEGRTVVQDYAIGPLGTIWLPAAYRPERVAGVRGARFDRDSGSLLAEAATVDGLRYLVTSTVPDLTAAQLQSAPATVPEDIAGQYLALPDTFPPAVRDLAATVTAGATTAYEKARLLQDWFRAPGNFRYDLNVDAGHDVNAMVDFLFVSKRGYCEQFAGTFAAMARALDVPARVAVGFVPGTPGGDGRYHVAGRDAHAWPEIYVAGYGWIAFEPTPGAGRTAPGTEAYTGVGAADGTAQDDGPATTTSTTVGDPAAAPPVAPEDEEAAPSSPAAAPAAGANPVARALLVVALLASLYAFGVPAAQRWLVQHRRRAASTPTRQVLLAWQETEDALAMAGHPRRPSETAGEFAARSAATGAVVAAAPHLSLLADHTTAAGFSAGGAPGSVVPAARQAAAAVATELRARASRLTRVRWALDPRPLVEAVAGRRREATPPS